jgi:filamentous hemagglutinin family protein
MKYNKKTLNNSLFTKVLACLMVFVFAVDTVSAVPSIAPTNLQTTAGVTVTGAGTTLSIVAPNKSVLTWQNFGSGTDTIAIGDALHYTLPSNNASVLNIVAGGASSTINGTLSSNGNVYVLNPNGILIGGSARIDVNRLGLSTSDNPSFASFYFQQNGFLPSQDGLTPVAGNTTINNGAIIAVSENITIVSKNITVNGVLSQGNLVLNADGNVTIGSAGMAYIAGNLTINNPTGTTTIGSVGNNTIVTNNLVVNGNATSAFSSVATGTIQAKTLNVTAGTILADRISTSNTTVTGTNVTVNVGSGAGTPSVTAVGSGTVQITAPASLTVNVTNSGAGATSVSAGGNLTLGKVQVEGLAGASFTGASVTDTSSRIFVYGGAAFTATAGNVNIDKGQHSFGPVSVSATGEALIFEDAATQLNIVNTPKLTLRSADYVFQTPTTGVVNSALVSVVGAGNITLGAATNSAGNYTVVGNDVMFANNGALSISTAATGNASVASTGVVTLGSTATGGTLTVTSTGAITQAVDTKVYALGAANFVGTGLTLSNAGNGFGGITVDVGTVGTATITEETTLNLVSLRAANATVKSTFDVITTGILPVVADTFNVVVGGNFVPAANFRAINGITVLSGGNVDLSNLSLITNLNNKSPSIIAKGYKAPQP